MTSGSGFVSGSCLPSPTITIALMGTGSL